MSVLKLKISTARATGFLTGNFQASTGGREIVNRLLNYLTSLGCGSESAMSSTVPPTLEISVQESEVRASGTFTLTSAIATNSISINGVTFTAVASGATGNQFNIGGTDTITAANLAAAINASVTAKVAGYVTATSALGVVTVTSAFYGLSGNQTLIASASGTIVASGAALTGGTTDASAKTLTF